MMRLTAGGVLDTAFACVNGIRGLPFSGYTGSFRSLSCQQRGAISAPWWSWAEV